MPTKIRIFTMTTLATMGFIVSSFTSCFSDQTVKKLPEAVVKAVSDNPGILANKAAQEATEHRIDFAKGGYYPTLDLQFGGGHEYTRQKYRENSLNSSKVSGAVATDRYDPAIRVRQMVFDGFETPHQVEKAENERLQAERKTLETEELTAFSACEQYIAVRRFGRLLRLAEDNVSVHKNILSKVQALISAGKATVADRHNVESRLHDAEAAVQDIQGDLDSAVAQFIDVVGSKPGRLVNAEISKEHIPATINEALEVARKNNHSLVLAEASIDVAKSDIDVVRSAYYPRLDIELDATRRHNVGAKSGFENNLTALAVVRFNVFNGGKDSARVRELRAKMTEAKYLMKNQKRTAEREVRVSWSEMRSALGQAKVLRQAVEAKKSVRDTYLEQFRLGQRSFLDILDASHEFFLAKGSLITADATYDLANARLLASTGLLKKTILDLI